MILERTQNLRSFPESTNTPPNSNQGENASLLLTGYRYCAHSLPLLDRMFGLNISVEEESYLLSFATDVLL